MNAALEHIDRVVTPNGADSVMADDNDAARPLADLDKAVDRAVERLPLNGQYGVECFGLRASARKRLAQAAFKQRGGKELKHRDPYDLLEQAWVDYDLFRGPAGLVLAGASNSGPTEPFVPAVRHLAHLCDAPSLERMRAGTEISEPSAFNIGRINTGMGHGVAGVASALRHAVETLDDGNDYRQALRFACDWLVEEAYLADRDFITWPPVGRDGAKAPRVSDRCVAVIHGSGRSDAR
jgi:hypothetical protein